MKPFLRIWLTSGHSYEIQTAAIAADRAAHIHQRCPDECPTLESAAADTIEFFGDDGEITEWLFNEMDVDETLRSHGRLIGYTPGAPGVVDTELHDTPAPTPTIDGKSALGAPLELVVESLAAAGALCNVYVLHSTSTGQAESAVFLVQGGPSVVNTYLAAAQAATNAINEANAAAEQPAAAH